MDKSDLNSVWAKVRESIENGCLRNHEGARTQIHMGPTGLDAKTTREQFIKKACARPVTPNDKPVAVSGNTKCYYKCQPEDIIMFISVFLKYGNNITKALRELKNHQIIEMKCYLYGIETNAPKHRKLKRGQLSLSRIALAFPIHTAAMILKNETEGILEYSSFFKQKLPLIMQHTVFPGLIPAEKFTDELRGITYILNMEISVALFSRTLSLKSWDDMERNRDIMENTETVEVMVESSAKYVDAAINNDIEDDKKLKILTKAGILEVNADGELELSAGTVALLNKLAGLKALYSLSFYDALNKLQSEE